MKMKRGLYEYRLRQRLIATVSNQHDATIMRARRLRQLWSSTTDEHPRISFTAVSSSTRRAAVVCCVLALLLHPAAASIFGRNSRGTAAIFGNLLGNRDNNSGRHPSPPLPSSPHHATNWDAPPPPPPPPPPPRVSEDGTVNVILTLQQREQIHLRQLNVLTERIMEMEAITAAERNQLLEWQENCTSLINQMASLEEEASEDRKRCQELTEQYEQGVATQNKLKDELKVALRQAEDLAALIERHRLQGDEDGEDYETFRKKKKKRKRGFFAWLFGWGREDDDSMDNVDEVYEQARSTLLKALQTERNNVDELEMAVASLQQNNSAIAEQVQSRDLVIEQLNNRVAVFEDDKVVLKAALKQLQKEMKEEAPKTLKLAEDAKQAQQEIERLKNEIEAMIQSHKQEIARLQKIIAEKEMHVQESLGNLTEIGTYVDKLESRLADFAVARRDMEKREEKCQELEELSKLVTEERDALKTQLTEYETEREEHKHLLQELVEERTSLKSQTDRGALEQNAMRLRGSLAKLEIDYKALDRTNIQLQSRIRDLESQQSGHDVSQQRLEDKLASTDKRMEELQSSLVSATQEKKELSEKLSEAEKSKDELLKKVDDLTKSVDDYSSPERAEESRVKEVATREIQMALQDSLKLADSMREQLRDKQSDLDHTKYELETVRQAKQTLEAKLLEHAQRSMDSSAASTSTVLTVEESGIYEEFRSDPPIHLSLERLLPNVCHVSCRSRPLAGFTMEPASVIIPVKSFSGRFSDTNKRLSQRLMTRSQARLSLTTNTGNSTHLQQQQQQQQHRTDSQAFSISRWLGFGQSQSKREKVHSVNSSVVASSETGQGNRTRADDYAPTARPKPVPNVPAPQLRLPAFPISNQTHERKVLFRKFRKLAAKTTGIHGLFTKPSNPRPRPNKTRGHWLRKTTRPISNSSHTVLKQPSPLSRQNAATSSSIEQRTSPFEKLLPQHNQAPPDFSYSSLPFKGTNRLAQQSHSQEGATSKGFVSGAALLDRSSATVQGGPTQPRNEKESKLVSPNLDKD